MQLDNGTYIDWWPQGNGPYSPYGYYPARSDPDSQTLEGNIYMENGVSPDFAIKITGLDEDAIQKWWDSFRSDPNNEWNVLLQNCSSIVADALAVGGADKVLGPYYWIESFDYSVWTPAAALAYAGMISATIDSNTMASMFTTYYSFIDIDIDFDLLD